MLTSINSSQIRKSTHYLKLLDTVYCLSRGITDKKGMESRYDKSREALFDNFDSYSQDEKVYIFRSIMNVYQLKMNLASDKGAIKDMNRKQYELMKISIEKDVYKSQKEKYMPLFLSGTFLFHRWSIKITNGQRSSSRAILKSSNRITGIICLISQWLCFYSIKISSKKAWGISQWLNMRPFF